MRGAAKRERPAFAGALVLATLAIAVIAGLALGGRSSRAERASSAVRHYAVLSFESPHVASSYPTYSVAPGQEGPAPAPTQALSSAASFATPIAEYRRYAQGRLAAAEREAGSLLEALRSGSRERSEERWRGTYADYLELGAVYLTEPLASLNDRIDGTPGGLTGGVSSPRFTGLHRIEYGLWNDEPPTTLARFAARLRSDLAAMAAALPHAEPTPTEYATRAHEILEDAQRDQASGTAVPWSGEGVLGTAAGLNATRKVISTLHGLLHEEDGEHPPVGPPIEAELEALGSTLDSISAAHGGRLPSNEGLTQTQDERLQAALSGALEALSQVPPALEAEPAPKPIEIPKSDLRIDP